MKKTSPAVWLLILAFSFVFGLALLSRGTLTGQITAQALPMTNGTVLSAIAAVLSIGVLLVAGLQKH